MEAGHPPGDRPDYGLDAPWVVRNLFLAGGAGLAFVLLDALGIWSGRLVLGPVGGVTILFPLASMGLWIGIACTAMGAYMAWSSRFGKVREREVLLDSVPWGGHERVLDVGCGRGLLLVGAARRLPSGLACGVDVWSLEDLSGNAPGATLENARREGVRDRVAIHTADMRRLPFRSGAFDVIVSRAAIHNLYSREARAEAVAEIARVLKPGGHALIDDIRHTAQYAAAFRKAGCRVDRVGSPVATVFLALVTMGSLRPAVLRVRKDS